MPHRFPSGMARECIGNDAATCVRHRPRWILFCPEISVELRRLDARNGEHGLPGLPFEDV